MIWVRRTAAVALGFPLLGLLLGTLLLQGVNATFLSADFYTDQLEEADAYRFVMDDVLSSAVDELREGDPEEAGLDLRENPVAASGLDTPRIIEAVQRALSPEELEARVAPAVHELAGYATGESDTLTIDLELAPVVRDLVAELQALMREAGVYERLLEGELEPRIREAAGDSLADDGTEPGWDRRLFEGDAEDGDRLADVATGIVTPEWFATQVEHVLDELTAYLVGDADGFQILIRLGDDQVAAATEELKSILRETDASELVYEEILDPTVDETLDETIALPYGVEVSREEVKELLRKAAPPAWVRQQADRLIEDVSAYVTGTTEGFSTVIPLTERKEAAAELLTELAVARVEQSVRGLAACSADTAAAALAALESGRLPDCLPPGVAADDLVEDARSAIAEAVPPLVLGPVPDAVTYGDGDLRFDVRADGGPDALDALDDSRELFAEGWSYSDADLRVDLASDPELLDGLDRFRDFVANGYVHTRGDPAASGFAQVLDEAHDGAGSFLGSSVAAWLTVAVLLVAIGALGGTSWPNRVVWASASLLACALVVLVQFWPVYEFVSGGVIELAREEVAGWSDEDAGPTLRLVAAKSIDVAESASDDFIAAVRPPSIVVALVALAALLAALFGPRMIRPDRTLQEQALEER